ncbi:EAL domain-containing protein (plasmid) [Skermanella sp. TT6]|uniref:EAL domain-containing protein n=1 Tax=Skermanella cutis TaxID=2775420 RepID=A0ABX7BHH0_9PROT|nr:EAL domain-containing protein [Skermanella sp. TT6]QQP93837.1 EAL domain-containing protein [Skermanella sp. TT6]
MLAYSLIHTAREANRIDQERAVQAVGASLELTFRRIAAQAGDNGYWDDAVRAIYGPLDLDFVERTWGILTGEGHNYDSMFILNAGDATISGFAGGQPTMQSAASLYGPALDALLATLDPRGTEPVGGLVRTDAGPAIIGIANIVPTSPALAQRIAGDHPHRLVFSQQLSQPMLDEMANTLLVEDLRPGPPASDRSALTLRDSLGEAIGTLSWRRAEPGLEALRTALPSVLGALTITAGLLWFVAAQGLGSLVSLARQALVDGLSGLPNRRSLLVELDQAKDATVLLLLDLDGFKGVNDCYGHGVGDELILAVARLLRELAGPAGFIARLGGDEFALVFTGGEAPARARAVAALLLDRLAAPFHLGERTVLIGASIGFADRRRGELSTEELIRRADVAMYAAKHAGRMRLCVFDAALDQARQKAHRIETELRASLLTDQGLTVVYQPLVRARDRAVSSVEALLRWTSPVLGVVSPAEFVPIAEESGLIDALGLFVLQRACAEALTWPDLKVAVNVSAAQLRNPGFPASLAGILAETGFPPARLELEITETYLVGSPDVAERVLDQLKRLGVTVALDDFGTGYASIGFLRQFRFDKLKLDRSMIVDAVDSATAQALVQASVAVARALDMQVVAEGVETERQAELMRRAGCDHLQGWLFSRAVTAEQISRLAHYLPEDLEAAGPVAQREHAT